MTTIAPTPWYRDERLDVRDANGRWTLQVDEATVEDDIELIDRILRAVNNHDALVAALTHISLCSQNSASSKEECGRIAREALAAARGETS